MHRNLKVGPIDIRDKDLLSDLELLIELELISFSKIRDLERFTLEIPLMGLWLESKFDFKAQRAKTILETEKNDESK